MFNKKEIEQQKQDLTESCQKCKHLVLKSDMKQIQLSNVSWILGHQDKVLWYCPEHLPNYDRTYIDFEYKPRYFREMEVTENGEPIGYIKSINKGK